MSNEQAAAASQPAQPIPTSAAVPSQQALLALAARASWTPRRRDAAVLLDLLLTYLPAADDDKAADAARLLLTRALDRIAGDAFAQGLLRVPQIDGAGRPALFALLARWAVLCAPRDATPLQESLRLLDHPDVRAARQVVIALGKVDGPHAWTASRSPPMCAPSSNRWASWRPGAMGLHVPKTAQSRSCRRCERWLRVRPGRRSCPT
jgi:hypothetical protein